jgi:hypothetical protein
VDYRNAFDMTGSVAVITGGTRGSAWSRQWRLDHAERRSFWRVAIGAGLSGKQFRRVKRSPAPTDTPSSSRT